MPEDRKIITSVVGGLLLAVAALASQPGDVRPEQTACPPPRECPFPLVEAIDLPVPWREPNYAGGSCVHASMVMVLRWQGHHELARWWRASYSGGEYAHGLIGKAERAGLRYASTRSGDARFLDWCSRTRRGAVIFYFPAHSIVFCGFDAGDALLLDNNRVERTIRVPRARFLSAWRGYGGFAFTPVYDPPPLVIRICLMEETPCCAVCEFCV